MQKNQENFNGILQQKYEAESVYIHEFNEKLKSFAPSVQDEYIAENVNGIKQNNGLLQKSLIENNMSYVDYANKVYTNNRRKYQYSSRKVFRMQKTLKSSGGRRLECSKKYQRQPTSKENQNILAELFSKASIYKIGKYGIYTGLSIYR